MNSVALIGRLTKDPEVRAAGDGSVATFTLAIDRPPKQDGQQETDFPRVVAFGRKADHAERWLKKGMLVGITGHIQTGRYEGRDGQMVYTTDVIADRITMVEWPKTDGGPKTDGRPHGEGMVNTPQKPEEGVQQRMPEQYRNPFSGDDGYYY